MRLIVWFLSVLAASILMSLPAFAQNFSLEQKLSDFEQLNQLIDSKYGPLYFKKERLQLDLDSLRADFRARIEKAETNAEFYYLILEYVAAYQDGHFAAYLASDYTATVPIRTDLIGGKVLIDTIDRDKLSAEKFPFERGDEIVSIDGQSISDVLDDLSRFVGTGYEFATRRIAALQVFHRRASRLPVPEKKTLTVEVRRGTSDVIDSAELEWTFEGTRFDEAEEPKEMVVPFGLKPGKAFDYDLISMRDSLESLIGPERLAESYSCSGKTRIKIPDEATVIMKEPFVAYYHPTDKGPVGYLRIPHYYPMDDKKEPAFEERFAQYEYALSELEANTVGLVIDQDHNCGGSVDYLESLIGIFMAEPFQAMKFELIASKSEYLEFNKWREMSWKNTLSYQGLGKVLDLIKESWIKGDFLTPKTSIHGVETLQPQAVQYTKPVLILIDEMSGSGGDAFPALMQGYGRAKLLGTRTMGLGGHVSSQPTLNYSGIGLRMTKSLFYRPDGVPVENNGAVPDITYTPTRDDFLYEYQGYRKFYLQELLKLVD